MLIFCEAPHRLLESLAGMRDVSGEECRTVLARELSKTFETIRSLPLAGLHGWVTSDSNQQRGECIVLVAGWQASKGEESIGAEALRVLDLLLVELPLRKATVLAAEIVGVRKNLLYQRALQRQGENWAYSSRLLPSTLLTESRLDSHCRTIARWRKVRAPQGRVPGNAQEARAYGKCHRK